MLGEKDPVHLISMAKQARRKLQHAGSRDGKSSKLSKKPMRIEVSEERDREDITNRKFQAVFLQVFFCNLSISSKA